MMMMPAPRLEVSPTVLETFANSRGGSARALQLVIEKDAVVLAESIEASDAVEADCEKMAALIKGRADPCYFLFQPNADAPWFLLFYIPPGCKPKGRMMYATSLDTVRKALGADVPFTIHCTEEGGLLWNSLEGEVAGHLTPTSCDARTEAEKLRDELDKAVVAEGATKAYVHGVQLPFSESAAEAVKHLADNKLNAITLVVQHEAIEVERQVEDPIPIEDLVTGLPNDEPRFVLFRFHHEHEDKELCNNVFIYVCPVGCKVKLRMLFSTTKASVITQAGSLGLHLDAKLEYGDLAEITSDALRAALHSTATEEDAAHAKVLEKPQAARGVRVMF